MCIKRIYFVFFLFCLLFSGLSFSEEPSTRIVNGENTQDNASTGALLRVLPQGDSVALETVCSGTMVGCQDFLTAAHCVCNSGANPGEFEFCNPKSPESYRVYLQNGGIYGVKSIKINPAYDFGDGGDVAVLTLNQPMTGVLPTPINTVDTPSYGTTGKIVGFGLTRGDALDFGVKRQGKVFTTNCLNLGSSVPEPEHLCWKFESPVGPTGEDSNTCSGDSGGPLFIDMGDGDVVAGVTSGGFNPQCLPTDLSFDANVFENKDFIEDAIISEDPNNDVGLSKEVIKCRSLVRKLSDKYIKSVYKSKQKCIKSVNGGKSTDNCPDAKAQSGILKAESKLDPAKIAKSCPADVILKAGLSGECDDASTPAELKNCIMDAGDEAVDRMLDVEYANQYPTTGIADKDLAKCQASIAKVSSSFMLKGLKTLNKCESSKDKGKITDCPDEKTASKINKLIAKVDSGIKKACTDIQIETLNAANAFGRSCAGSDSLFDIINCQLEEHEEINEELLELASGELDDDIEEVNSCGIGSQVGDENTVVINHTRATGTASSSEFISYQFEVAPGTTSFRVTLNGEEIRTEVTTSFFVDLDLFIKSGSVPTTVDFDFSSINFGVFEAVEVSAPASGTWHILVQDLGEDGLPFQLTVTSFTE